MAQFLAAGQVHNWFLPCAPYLDVIMNFDVCLDLDFIDRSRYCGVITVWQLNIWGTGRVHIQGKDASHFAQLLLNAKDISLHSDPQPQLSPVLSESRPQARLEVISCALLILCLASFRFVSVFGFPRCLPSCVASWGVLGSSFWGLRFPSFLVFLAA